MSSGLNDAFKTLRARAERMTDEDAENDADRAFSLAVDVLEFLTKVEDEFPKVRREGVVEGENEFARWIDRKGAIILDSGEDEKAVDALQRYRMGRGW